MQLKKREGAACRSCVAENGKEWTNKSAKKGQAGRSMLEMLGVLGIIALLSVTGTLGYSYLIQQHNKQETTRELESVVVALRTGRGARGKDAGKIVKMGQLIKGPKTENGGNSLVLPGEESYAVVASTQNGYALALQVEEGTCQVVLDALADQGLTVFNAEIYQSMEPGSRVSSGALISALESNVTSKVGKEGNGYLSKGSEAYEAALKGCLNVGRLDVMTGCMEGGSTGTGYYQDGTCEECQNYDDYGKCCERFACEANGHKLCFCADNAVLDPTSCTCVPCLGDSDCWTKYKGKPDLERWQHHVCEAQKSCVECLNDNDCKHPTLDQARPTNPTDGDKVKTHCSENKKCVECTTNYGSSVGIPCKSVDKPMCQNDVCVPCDTGLSWNAQTGSCVCPAGTVYNAKNGKCVACYVTDSGASVGCNTTHPICNETLKTEINKVEYDGKCIECNVDEECPHDRRPNYYCEDHSCTPCPTDRPLRRNGVCVTCWNSDLGAGTDMGCESGDNHYCEETANSGFGQCRSCLDSASGGFQDGGCGSGTNANKNICVTDNKKNDGTYDLGSSCALCYDDKTDTGVDSGCGTGANANKPFCVGTGSENYAIGGTNAIGTVCHKCINDKADAVADTGCEDPAKPMCDAADGAWGDSCKSCPSGQLLHNGKCVNCWDSDAGTGTDEGCSSGDKHYCDEAANGGLGECKLCLDSAAKGGRDAGCGADKPICQATGKRNTGATPYALGTQCAVCLNDQTDNQKVDSGCSTKKPMCNGAQGDYGTACATCGGSNECIDATGVSGTANACISLSSYDDIVRGSDGKCECIAAVKTQTVNDMGNSYTGSYPMDKGIDRLITTRKRKYTIPVNFYCPRYMHVSDNAGADDYVVSSNPSGIGANSKHDTWCEAHDNSISPRVSDSKIQKGTASVVVSDRWCCEVGLNGYFYFTTAKKGTASGAVKKLTATAAWKSGSTKNGNENGYREAKCR